ncbi:TIR domain-containing protein [Paraburkholderia sediminicola]
MPRDNVAFELGLSMARLGKDSTALMEPRDYKACNRST